MRNQQAELARAHGVTGFIYWDYWFGGRRLLERPFEEVVASGEPQFPFCVAWANHSWSDRWMGGEERIMVEQTYPRAEDDRAHFEHLRTAFQDPRYVRVNGSPVMFVFRSPDMPDPAGFVERWKAMARDLGGLYLVSCGSFVDPVETAAQGFDAIVFIENPFALPTATPRLNSYLRNHHIRRGPYRYDYADLCGSAPPSDLACTAIPCVWPNWDDTPRRGRRGVVAVHSSPTRFRRQVASAVEIARRAPRSEQIIAIKSWNEWAEGNYLEPDQEFGTGWLEALARGPADQGVVPQPEPESVEPEGQLPIPSRRATTANCGYRMSRNLPTRRPAPRTRIGLIGVRLSIRNPAPAKRPSIEARVKNRRWVRSRTPQSV